MPYVRKRSILQRAPRFQLVGRGMGDASCPSAEQLMGVSDPSDPCQNPVAGLPVSTVPTLAMPSTLLPSTATPAQQAALNLYFAGLSTSPTTLPASNSVANFVAQYQTPLLIGGGLLLLVALLPRGRR
jgi:hypothetical protein